MQYAPPDQAARCPCRDAGAPPMFCPTGHLLECHHPLNCREASCSHLPRYEEVTPTQQECLDQAALARLSTLANQDCHHCGGQGHTEVMIDSGIPVPQDFAHLIQTPTFVYTALSICPCVIDRGPAPPSVN